MAQYLTFLLDLASEREDRTIAATLAFHPAKDVLPKNAFHWKVIHDGAGQVFVIAKLARGGYELIATATYTVLGLEQRERLEHLTVPTEFQWNAVAAALAANLAKAPDEPSDTTVVDKAELVVAYRSSKPGARFVAPPPELASNIDMRRAPPKRARDRTTKVLVGMTIAAVLLAIGVLSHVIRTPKGAAIHDAAPVRRVPAAPVAPLPADPVAEAAATMRWADVAGARETTIELVLKDWEAERGKKLCVTGVIARIERRDVDRRKTFTGGLITDDGDAVSFVAVGSTGDLVRNRHATFCGIVTGKLALLGMFDVPENQLPVVEQ